VSVKFEWGIQIGSWAMTQEFAAGRAMPEPETHEVESEMEVGFVVHDGDVH